MHGQGPIGVTTSAQAWRRIPAAIPRLADLAAVPAFMYAVHALFASEILGIAAAWLLGSVLSFEVLLRWCRRARGR